MVRWKNIGAFFNPKGITSHFHNLLLPWNAVFLQSFVANIIGLKPCLRSRIVKMFESPMLSNSFSGMGMGYLSWGVTRFKGLYSLHILFLVHNLAESFFASVIVAVTKLELNGWMRLASWNFLHHGIPTHACSTYASSNKRVSFVRSIKNYMVLYLPKFFIENVNTFSYLISKSVT